MVNHYFVFDGKASDDFGVLLGNVDNPSAERDFETQSVDGRNGDLIFDNKRYKNVTMSYGKSIIYQNYEQNSQGLRNWLLSKSSYCRLEDSFNPDEFYLAMFQGAFEPEEDKDREMGKFTLKFNRKPQRFLKIGEDVISITSSSSTIMNPGMESEPLLRIYGNGSARINGTLITVTGNSLSYVDIDSDIHECFHETTPLNSIVESSTNNYPTLSSGENVITIVSGITQIDVTPRWWIL